MAGIDVGTTGGSGRRAVNSEINMIPFIDFLLVTVAFLLITAVWVTFSRVNANAQLPGKPDVDTPYPVEKTLHVHVKPEQFALVWKHGATTISETRVKREPDRGDLTRYANLEKALAEEWKTHGQHQDPADPKPDLAVLHTHDNAPFRELIATIDAVYATQRDRHVPGGQQEKIPVFNVAFSSK
ncbi:MAG: biopolymer transporter ExbD [Deltaproteobacteria bacterium]|jgi:biopolymer transport protein ExbD|nr:biopolymer transporter ExbD [Deltaproteobacteria bacterium]MBW2535010.1 biopolymer transporter ExbD [Deltaproteobacteria bacterium]